MNTSECTSKMRMRHKPSERGNALILALLAMMLAVAVMLWVTQLSADNFRRTDRHLYQEDAYFAATGTADAVVNDLRRAYDAAYDKGQTAAAADFKTWLAGYNPLLAIDNKSVELTGWKGQKFNSATVNKVRVTRLPDNGSDAKGWLVTLRVEVEAMPSNSEDPADFVTVTRVLNATNRKRPDTEYAILTENISCTLCHLRVSTLEYAKNVEGEPANNNTFQRALIATTKYMNARFDTADTEIHGTFYIAAGARVENHGKTDELTREVLNSGNFRMARLSPQNDDANGNKVSTFGKKVDENGNFVLDIIGTSAHPDLVDSTPKPNEDLVPNKNLYLKYPGVGDYNLEETFPSPFPDTGDANGVGAKNRRIDDIELLAKKSEAIGTIKSFYATHVDLNTNEKYATGTYTYPDSKLPSTAIPVETEIKTGEKTNLILIGTKEHPIEINGDVVIDGDVMIKGYVKGTGVVYATGNVYIPSDIKYDNPIDKNKKETFADANRVGYAAGGNIVIGDYISKVTSHSSSYDTDENGDLTGRVEVGEREYVKDKNGNLVDSNNYANYVAEQLAISNRDELAKTLKTVPKGGGDLKNAATYGEQNPAYDPTYTPRYYTMYPNTDPYAFIKNNSSDNAATFDRTTKSWITGETPNIFSRDQFSIYKVPPSVRDTTNTPRTISVHPNWISPENMIRLIADEESKRISDTERNGKAFRIDGLLYTNNGIFSIQRRMSQVVDANGNWKRVDASHRGQMEINGSVIAPDLGILVAGGAQNSFRVNYDRRLNGLINGFEPALWKTSVDGFARFSGPMAP